MTGRSAIALLALLLLATVAAGPSHLAALVAAPNADGLALTLSAAGGMTADHPFFRPLGSSGRSCAGRGNERIRPARDQRNTVL